MTDFPLPPPEFSGATRRVRLGDSLEWISQGWLTFLAAPKHWLALGAMLLIFWEAVGGLWWWLFHHEPVVLPEQLRSAVGYALLLGPMTLLPIVIGGGLYACRKIGNGEAMTLSDLFWGFRSKAMRLLVAGFIFLAGWLALFAFGVFVEGPLAIFLPLVAGFAFLMAIWFMPALVSFHDVAPLTALARSFVACGRNGGAFLVFGFVMMLLNVLAILPAGLGLLLLLPVVIGAMYASYRDVFPES